MKRSALRKSKDAGRWNATGRWPMSSARAQMSWRVSWPPRKPRGVPPRKKLAGVQRRPTGNVLPKKRRTGGWLLWTPSRLRAAR